MNQDDDIRLKHMLDAAEEAIGFAEGRSRTDLDHDRMLVLAIMKDIEIIGEGASKLSYEFRSLYPEIPWSRIIGMRNRLTHAYFDINLNVLWHTVTVNLPALKEQLEGILKA